MRLALGIWAAFNSAQFVWLSQLLLYNARKLESEGHLDEALACYVAVARLADSPNVGLVWIDQWAMKVDQTGARIKKAIHEFESMEPKSGALSSEILRDWGRDRISAASGRLARVASQPESAKRLGAVVDPLVLSVGTHPAGEAR